MTWRVSRDDIAEIRIACGNYAFSKENGAGAAYLVSIRGAFES